MAKQQPVQTHIPLLMIAAFLAAFALGLLAALFQPGAVVALLVLLLVVIAALLGSAFYLWQEIKRKELSKPVRAKRSLPKGVTQ